ncbi:MAG: DUF3105 domain-containing protein, partial [Candidatus Limnocylindrales bacterium]
AKPATGAKPTSAKPGSKPPASRSSSRSGSSNRPRRTLYQPSFYERHRTALLSLVVVAIVAVVGGFFFFSATASAYSCTTITQPQPTGTPLPNGSPALLGQAQPDMGNLHIAVGSNQRYSYCPPASGPHYNNPGIDGPIPAKFYGPDDGTRPEGWIHNLEHGAVVILYNCNLGACTDTNQAALQALTVNFPDSPVCKVRAGVLAPVIARFDNMPAPYAALVWDRLLYLTSVDRDQILQFYATEAETTNPEMQCTRPSPGAVPSGAASPAASPASSAAPSVAPSPAASPTVSASPS